LVEEFPDYGSAIRVEFLPHQEAGISYEGNDFIYKRL
jgi:hypothetical protein